MKRDIGKLIEKGVKLAKMQVANGVHRIPYLIIERRYKPGLKNLINIFLPLVDDWLIYDNSGLKELLIAKKSADE